MVQKVIKLSVIVPFFNVDRYAPENLASLAQNASPDIEFMLVDDGSTDATSSILADGAERLRGSQLLRLGHNAGLSAARNAGLWRLVGVISAFSTATMSLLRATFCTAVGDRTAQRRLRSHRPSPGPRPPAVLGPHQPYAAGVVCPARSGIGRPGVRSSVDAPYAWAGVYDRRLVDAGLLGFDEDLRTCAKTEPWILEICTCARARLRWFGLHGVPLPERRLSVTDSASEIERQFDFVAAFERIVQQSAAPTATQRRCCRRHCDPFARLSVATSAWSIAVRPNCQREPARSDGAQLARIGNPADPLRATIAGTWTLTRLGLPGSLPAPPPPPRKSTLRPRVGQLARR